MTTHRPLSYVRTAGLDAAYLVLGLPIGIATFTVIVTGLSLGLGLAITLIGIPIVLATLVVARWLAALERQRTRLVLGNSIDPPERRLEGNVWKRTKTVVTDAATWLDTLWSLLLLPIGTIGFTVAVTVWSAALGMITSPIWQWAIPDDGDADLTFFNSTTAGYSVLRVLAGLALIPVAYWISRAFALGTAHLARLLLGERQEHSPSAPTAVLA